MWRLRAKRAWIREQLQALRGFPDAATDADYAEPWTDALGESSYHHFWFPARHPTEQAGANHVEP